MRLATPAATALSISQGGCDRLNFLAHSKKKLNPIRGLSAVSFIAETGRGVSTSSPRSVLACDGILLCYTVSSLAECMAGVHDRANSSTRQRIACVGEFYNPVSRGGWHVSRPRQLSFLSAPAAPARWRARGRRYRARQRSVPIANTQPRSATVGVTFAPKTARLASNVAEKQHS
jgi:hypothetical protein